MLMLLRQLQLIIRNLKNQRIIKSGNKMREVEEEVEIEEIEVVSHVEEEDIEVTEVEMKGNIVEEEDIEIEMVKTAVEMKNQEQREA